MNYLLVCTVALLVSALTLVSGFGLGTLLLPAFALFFPLEIAVAATAVVHLANSLFKLAVVGRWARWTVVLCFGAPAIVAAAAGAFSLTFLADLPALASYELAGRTSHISPIKLVVGTLIAAFGAIELFAWFNRLELPTRAIPLGGALSGFFGGLSGHQGALRSAFLVRAGLDRHAYVGTTAACAALVDISRLIVYALGMSHLGAGAFHRLREADGLALIAAASACALAGTLIGSRLVRKTTMRFIRRLVGAMLLASGIAIAAGIL